MPNIFSASSPPHVGEREKTMRRAHQITGGVFLLLAVYVAIEALQLRYYTPLGPGPGFFAFWLACVLGGLAVIMLLQATLGPLERMPLDFFADKSGYLRVGSVVFALIAVVALLKPFGFRLTMFGVNLFLLSVLGRSGWFMALLIALVGSFGVFHVFTQWLMVQLPVASFGL